MEKHVGEFVYWDACLLGKGATGNVYKGKNKIYGNHVAVKVIRQAELKSQVLSYLLNNQVKACTTLSNRNILHTYNVLRQNGLCYIVSQLYEGGNLRQLINKKGKLPERQALTLFEGILRGYRSMVTARVLHRDLKGDNILLTFDNQPIIIDFGYCEFLDSQNKPKISYNVGSTGYMSPESYNYNTYSEKSDIWSLGVILHEMVTGSMLKMNIKNTNMYFKDLEKRRYPAMKINFENEIVMQLLFRALNVNPSERASLSQLLSMIESWKKKSVQVKEDLSQRTRTSSMSYGEKPKAKLEIVSKNEPIYTTEKIQTPQKPTVKKEKGFEKLKRRIMNKEGDNSFTIKPIKITPIQTKNRYLNTPSIENSPSNPESPIGRSPVRCVSPPSAPKFSRKPASMSAKNLRMKLKMIG